MRVYRESAEFASLALAAEPFLGREGLVIAHMTQEEGPTANNLVKIVPLSGDTVTLRIGHDERRAPFAIGPDGAEEACFVSFTDELDCSICAFCAAPLGTAVGLGIDLCSNDEFSDTPANRRFAKRFFTSAENALEVNCPSNELAQLRARLFSGKEAAFKATSQALRSYYRSNSDEIRFTVRDFEIDNGKAHGTRRCRDALRKLGITHVHVHSIAYRSMTLTCAVATHNERTPL